MLYLAIIWPIYYPMLQFKGGRRICHFINYTYWAHLILWTAFLPFRRIGGWRIRGDKQYVFCSNHTSYFDIPTVFRTLPRRFTIIGKKSINNIPLFGYMFKSLYIPVDRTSKMDKFRSYKASLERVENGDSVVIFPEGTIPEEGAPKMIPFLDGGFRIAIEKNIPVVPMTIVNNWKIMPDDGKKGMRWAPVIVVIHNPIETKDLTLDDLEWLTQKTYDTIQNELNRRHKL